MTKPFASNESFFAIRAPRLPLATITQISAGHDEMRQQLQVWLAMPGVEEALYLASPALIDSLNQWRAKPDTKQSLHKYLLRMNSRPTPFGLFSGIGLGKVTDKCSIICKDYFQDQRTTRLDVFYLSVLKAKVATLALRDKTLRYVPNSSHYFVAKQCRYIEPYQSNNSQQYRLSAIDTDEYFLTALSLAKQHLSFISLVEQFLLTYPEAAKSDIESYIGC